MNSCVPDKRDGAFDLLGRVKKSMLAAGGSPNMLQRWTNLLRPTRNRLRLAEFAQLCMPISIAKQKYFDAWFDYLICVGQR